MFQMFLAVVAEVMVSAVNDNQFGRLRRIPVSKRASWVGGPI